MAEIFQDDTTTKTEPKSSCFPCCFVFAGKFSDEKKLLPKTVNRKKTRLFSWSRKKSTVKTVPVNGVGLSENGSRSGEILLLKSDKKISSKPDTVPDQILPDQNSPKTRTRYEKAQSIILENRKNLDQLESNSCQRVSSRKMVAKKNSFSHPGSPENKYEVCQTTTILPPQKQKKEAAILTQENSHVQRKREEVGGKLDPVVGMSITMVTLIIMVVFGKVCAILCISAWFYFVSHFRTTVEEPHVIIKNDYSSGEVDVDSEEYKKKVVLEGFLERNHRNVAGIL